MKSIVRSAVSRLARPAHSAPFSTQLVANEQTVFPREREGVDYSLNWALAKSSVHPKNEAYHNLRAADLAARSQRGDKAESRQSAAVQHLDGAEFDALLREVAGRISEASAVLVQDGGLGSWRQCNLRVRAIADSAAAALDARHLLVRLPKLAAQEFAPAITLYAGAAGAPRVVVSAAKAAVIVTGPVSAAALQSGLFAAAAPQFLKKGAVAVASEAAIVNNRPVVVIGTQVPRGSFGGAHHVLSADGVSRLWQAVIQADGTLSPLPTATTPILARGPATLVFVGGKSGKLSAAEATAALSSVAGAAAPAVPEGWTAVRVTEEEAKGKTFEQLVKAL